MREVELAESRQELRRVLEAVASLQSDVPEVDAVAKEAQRAVDETGAAKVETEAKVLLAGKRLLGFTQSNTHDQHRSCARHRQAH